MDMIESHCCHGVKSRWRGIHEINSWHNTKATIGHVLHANQRNEICIRFELVALDKTVAALRKVSAPIQERALSKV
jgi:hypothetical protein